MHRRTMVIVIAVVALCVIAGVLALQNRNAATTDSSASDVKAASDASQQNGQQPDPTTDSKAEDAGTVVDPADASADSTRIAITATAYAPAAVSITSGTTVVWTNTADAPYTVTGNGTDGPQSGPLAKGESFAYTFTKIGTYAYKSQGDAALRGTITVTE